jgi:hypothetical protein
MLFTLAACSGTGTRDKSALLPVVRSSETAVFIQRKTERGNAVTMEVTLNGAKIAELGSYENTAAITKIAENTIVIRYSGFTGAFRDGHVRKFTMVPRQKRFFFVKDERIDWLGTLELRTYETSEDEFFHDVRNFRRPIPHKKNAPEPSV